METLYVDSNGAQDWADCRRLPSEATPRTSSVRQVMGAVFWGFFGVRKCAAMARDIMAIKPMQLILPGVVSAAIFVFTLLVIVRLITAGL